MTGKKAKEVEAQLLNWIRSGVPCREVADVVMGPRDEIRSSMRRYIADRVLGQCYGGDAIDRVLGVVAAEIEKGIRRGVWVNEHPERAEPFRLAGLAVEEIARQFREWIGG